MTPDQRQAIETLEAAVARCSEVGVLIAGMDSAIYAYALDDFGRWVAEGAVGQFAHEITVPPVAAQEET